MKSIGKTAFLGLTWPRDAKPTPPGAAGSAVDQNRAKNLSGEYATGPFSKTGAAASAGEFRLVTG